MRLKSSSQWPNSVASLRRNLRRAGVLKYRSATVTVVPGARAAGSTSPICGPSARLAAQSHAADAFQVLEAADLARGVARERERQVVARYAGAVVVDLDALRAALVQRHGDAARVRVEAVLEQLLEHRRGPLDHLAGGDLAHQEIGQDADRWHAKSI